MRHLRVGDGLTFRNRTSLVWGYLVENGRVKVEMWSDSGKKPARVSIVLKSQVALVNCAYTLLDDLGV
jgi:hypothetical protein